MRSPATRLKRATTIGKPKRIPAFWIWIAALLLAAGCSGETNVVEDRARSAASGDGDILIGAAWPFSTRNEGFREGLELAAEQLNGAGGVLGRPLRLVLEDDHATVTGGLAVAQKLAENTEIMAVIGHRSSAITVPAASIYERAGLLMLSPGSTSPALTRKDYRLVFRNIPSDEQIGQEMSRYAKQQGYKKLVIYYADDEYGRGLANMMEDTLSREGISVVDRFSYYEDARHLEKLVEEWRLLDVDALFVADTMPQAAEFIASVRRSGAALPIFGGDGLDSDNLWEIAQSAAEGVVAASIFNPTKADPTVQRFIADYQQKYGEEPGKWAAQGYDALMLLAYAMETAGTASPTEVAAALRNMPAWNGAAGPRKFTDNGEVDGMPVVIKEMQNGRFVYQD